MDEIKINMIEKTDEGLVLKLPTTSVEQVKGLKEKLGEKVDKVEGKQLSTNDYTNLEKADVAKIKNLATNETVAGIKSEVETLKTSKVDKIVGKGLSTNDYDNVEKAEVAKVKNKADTTYVNNGLNNKADKTELNKKIDKSNIIVDGMDVLPDIEEPSAERVISQKAVSEFTEILFTELSALTVLKTDITSDLAGTDKSKVLSQEAGNKLQTTKISGQIIKKGDLEPTLKENEVLFIYEV